MIEIHQIVPPNYNQMGVQIATGIEAADFPNFVGWGIGPVIANGSKVNTLWGVKGRNTGSGRVEIHVLDPLNWAGFLFQEPTALASGDVVHFSAYLIAPLTSNAETYTVWGVKTSNTGSGKVELHVVEPDNWNSFILQTPTAFEPSDAPNFGSWQVHSFEGSYLYTLYGIKTKNTENQGNIEVHGVQPGNWGEFWFQEPTSLSGDASNAAARYFIADVISYPNDFLDSLWQVTNQQPHSPGSIYLNVLAGPSTKGPIGQDTES
ncbi:MAG: hypothetical protein AAF353_04485 [Pseudomonadota bacterium]